ncbi:hypothetical protein AC249_AIPGENE2832 [Exaiptasia diaphana]|nr:hypothetical protein AC249_AIPGENE2832 [Exaiptasia diaphana]
MEPRQFNIYCGVREDIPVKLGINDMVISVISSARSNAVSDRFHSYTLKNNNREQKQEKEKNNNKLK